MNTIRISILNPKAAKLIKDLADLNLIAIEKVRGRGFRKVLRELRAKGEPTLTPEEINREVELVRGRRYVE